MSARELCGIPSRPGVYVDTRGGLTVDPEAAETYRSAGPDEDTWRPPPRQTPPPDAGRYSEVSPVEEGAVDDVVAYAARRLRLSPRERDALAALLAVMAHPVQQ